ncbi:GNAT family N-acetyltransferase [Actinomadura fibrosa]|uniref:GNAT family N-acetyltransferase n=1 Tax=Actinomadura fibrosa TaxID=111802 RepID=A0ABW2XQ10_9ACTN|nr:GNAT family protein [Actinomadura fibrosa]
MTAVTGPALDGDPHDPLVPFASLGTASGAAFGAAFGSVRTDDPTPDEPARTPSRVQLRVVRPSDAEALAELYQENRAYLRPWEPERGDAYFTVEGQRENIGDLCEAHGAGEMWPAVVLRDGEIVGRITLNNVLRGPLLSCFVAYWVARAHAGQGVATEAVRQALDVAFRVMRLHRVEAFTRVDNHASQRVLERNGFMAIGTARRHIHVDGRWHDQRIFERLAPWDDGIALLPPA